MDMTVGDIAALVGGVLEGDSAVRITGVNGIKQAGSGDLTFLREARYLPYLETSAASALLAAAVPEGCSIPVVVVEHPDLAFAQVLQYCEQEQVQQPVGVDATAVMGKSVILGRDVAVGAQVCIADGCVIGDRAVLYAGVYVGRGTVIGEDTVIYPHVVIREEIQIGARCVIHAGAVIGSDGFGFAPLGGQWMKIPQIGGVIVGDDVEIGSNTAIDRATFGHTRIGRGTKIDNLVQIGHNTEIGEHCAIAGKVGIAGSAVIGNHVRIGAAAGIKGHIDIGDGATIGAWAGVTKSVGPGKTVSGFPAMDHNLERRVLVAQQRTPALLRRVRQLERELQALKDKLDEQTEDRS